MINAAHVVIYTRDAEADRAFFRDVLGFPSVDAGQGWLIFALPPAELGIHPTDEKVEPASDVLKGRHQLYLMCDDVETTAPQLKGKGVEFTQPVNESTAPGSARQSGMGSADCPEAARRQRALSLSAEAPVAAKVRSSGSPRRIQINTDTKVPCTRA